MPVKKMFFLRPFPEKYLSSLLIVFFAFCTKSSGCNFCWLFCSLLFIVFTSMSFLHNCCFFAQAFFVLLLMQPFGLFICFQEIISSQTRRLDFQVAVLISPLCLRKFWVLRNEITLIGLSLS